MHESPVYDKIKWTMKRSCDVKRQIVLILLIFLAAAVFPPVILHAQEHEKTVRVGWYESPFNNIDEAGRRSGYAYEYQMKIAAYTGWDYEYVEGSWTELMQMLIDGDIDLMSDVSYTEERAEKMLFSELPMGTEEYYIFTAPGNNDITSSDPSSLNGKKIGVNRGSVQEDLFREWALENKVTANIQELTTTEAESLEMLEAGELDAYIILNAYMDPEHLVPVRRIGSSDFYFAVNKDHPELLTELNEAMIRIQEEDPYYNQTMFDKHVRRFASNAFLNDEESAWLDRHGPIRVGYQDNYMAFCASDPDTGELTGALKDYLESASDCLVNTHIDFTKSAFPTMASALEALDKGEVDCVFPANFGSYDGEEMEILMTPSIMRTDIYAVVRQSDLYFFSQRDNIVVAVNEGNTNYDAFLKDNFPEWQKKYFKDTAECLKAVSDGRADCLLISSYRYNNISRLCDRYHLATYATGTTLDYCFAVSEGETELYSIMTKTAGMIPDSTIDSALAHYLTQDAKLSLMDVIRDNIVIVMALISVTVLIILFLLFRSMRMEKRAQRLIKATETDDLTGLYNRDYFFNYANRMYRSRPAAAYDAIVLNIEQFHSINALNGREFGNTVLKALGDEVLAVARQNEGIAGRFGADRFDIYCRHTGDYQAIFDRLQKRVDGLSPNISIRLRMGVMPWQSDLDPVGQFDRARAACNMARGHYKEHLIIFDEKMRDQEMQDQRLLNDLRNALDGRQFEVYYQPKYNIQTDPPTLVSAEALIRWQHPELGTIPPDSFIPLFERNGKIGEVDKYVWEEAAAQTARWRDQFGVNIPVSINLSRVDVFDPELESILGSILERNSLKPESLKLEVTESAYTENADQVIKVVKELHSKGYTVEMDDFGTGYSSLSMLSAMPIDVLKMDRTFVQNIEHDERDIQLVALILGIAKRLNIPVIAEGVETEAQISILKDLGCEVVQGYFFSRPLRHSDFEAKIILKGEKGGAGQ